MAIRYYDEAISKKITKWVSGIEGGNTVTLLKPNEVSRLFQLKADKNNDKPLTLPVIAISREPSVTLTIPTKNNLSTDGKNIIFFDDGTVKLNAIPIELSYQLDIFTKRYDEGDEYLRSFVFNLINHPKMKILIPYNDTQVEKVCYIRLNPELVDNSDIAEHLFADEFTRWTIKFDIEDAYLFSAPIKSYAHIQDITLSTVNGSESEDEEVNDEADSNLNY